MCFTLGWAQGLLVDLVVIVAVVLIVKVLVPWAMSILGGGGAVITQIINIVLWAVVAIFVIYVIFGLIGCISSSGFSLLPTHR